MDAIPSITEPWDLRRPTAALLRELFELDEIRPMLKLPEPQDDAQAYLVDKLKESRSTVNQLQHEVLTRAELNDESVREIDYQISKAAFSLDQFSHWGIGYNNGVDFKRNALERDLSSLRRERRATLLKTWTDIKTLRAEFREALAEYKSLLSRLGLM